MQDMSGDIDQPGTPGPAVEAPTARARALREEIFGSALSLDEAAYVLGLDRTTVAKYLRDRVIFGFQIGREWLVPENELREYVQRSIQGRRPDAGPSRTLDDQHGPGERGLFERMRRDLPLGRRRHVKHEVSNPAPHLDRSTRRARVALALAREESVSLGHTFCGTEHLLLGLIREGHGIAARALAEAGVELEAARAAVRRVLRPDDGPVAVELGLTPRARMVVELASDEARRLGHAFIGTEHLLLGLLREGHGIAADVLEEFGVDLEGLRQRILRMIELHPADRPEHARGETEQHLPAEAVDPLVPDEQRSVCGVCSARSPHYARYCFNCGAALDPA